jgi:predicted MFS family arabinose efflux permease
MTTERATYREVFAHTEFSAIFLAHVASMLGDIVASVALMVLVYEKTHSPALSALTVTFAFLPYLVGGALFSAAAQRWPARRALVACNVISAVLVAVMALPQMPVAGLLALLVTVSAIAPVFGAVRAVTLVEILKPGPPYVLGRTLIRMVAQSAQIVGYGIGGILVAATSPRTALIVDAGSFMVSAVVLRLGTHERTPVAVGGRASMARESIRGWREVYQHKAVRRVLLFSWLLPACMVAPEALAAPYVTSIGGSARLIGFFLVAMPAGTVVADVVVGRLVSSSTQRRLIVPAALVTCLPLLAFGLEPRFALAAGLMFASGVGCGYTPGIDQQLINATPGELRSQALAISTAGLMSIQGLGFAVWGIAAEFIDPRYVILTAAIAGLIVIATLRRSCDAVPPLPPVRPVEPVPAG